MINYFLNMALKKQKTMRIELIKCVDDYLQDTVSRGGKGLYSIFFCKNYI